LPESSAEIEFYECPSCERSYARKCGAPLAYRWLHPVTVALYGVVFDEDPVARAVTQADAFSQARSPDELRRIVEEIELELSKPTHRVCDALGSRASEEKCREYLRAFTARTRQYL